MKSWGKKGSNHGSKYSYSGEFLLILCRNTRVCFLFPLKPLLWAHVRKGQRSKDDQGMFWPECIFIFLDEFMQAHSPWLQQIWQGRNFCSFNTKSFWKQSNQSDFGGREAAKTWKNHGGKRRLGDMFISFPTPFWSFSSKEEASECVFRKCELSTSRLKVNRFSLSLWKLVLYEKI